MSEKLIAVLQTLPEDRRMEIRGNAAWICCPNPDHQGGHENTPSFKIRLDHPGSGSCFCFGCGAHGNWRTTVQMLRLPSSARFLAEEVVSDAFSDEEEAEMLGKRRSLQRNDADFSEPWPSDEPWRGVPGWLVSSVGGRMVIAGDGREPILRLPVPVRGRVHGTVDCRIVPKDDGKNYINEKGRGNGWSKDVLFPFDFVRDLEMDIVAIVEGSRDALTTIANGLPALATLGSTSWNAKCAALVKSLSPKILVLLADPDDAGEKLNRAVWRDLSNCMQIIPIRLPSRIEVVDGKRRRKKLIDPADLNQPKLQRVLELSGINSDLAISLQEIRLHIGSRRAA